MGLKRYFAVLLAGLELLHEFILNIIGKADTKSTYSLFTIT